MNKSVAIKLVIILVVVALVYSIFWFFKVGQVEKQVNKFISENSAHMSAGQVEVSGFPLSQKITIRDLKFTLPTALLDKRQAVIKQLEAKAGIFSSDFSVALLEGVTVQDNNGLIANVEFGKEPEISISVAEGRITKFRYQDFGYRILDAEKQVVYAASSSVINLESVVGENEKITTKITANVKDIEGYDVLDAYKNSLEKRIMDGIKTGEIAIGNSAAPALVQAAPTSPAVAPQSGLQAAVPATPATTSQAPTPPAPTDVAANAVPAPVPAAISDTSIVKSNFILDAEYTLTPNQNEQLQVPTADPTQIQEIPLQYSKAIKINNLEFSNPLYKILINGEMNVLPDDNLPSGGIAVKVEKVDNLINQITSGFNQMADKTKPVADLQSVDVASSAIPIEDSYQIFLKRIATNLNPVAKELAAKNAVSKEDIVQFDVRREKNLDFLINETPLREVLGKF